MVTEGAIFDGGFSVVNEDVGAGRNKLSVEETAVQGCFPTAVADGFKFFKTVGELKQTGRAFKSASFAPEVEAETITDDGDVEKDGDVHEFADLFFGQELSFIDEDASDSFIVFLDFFEEIIGRLNSEVGGTFGADTSEEFIAVFRIGFWFRDADGMAAFFVVKGDLKELHGFSATHRAVAKIEFCHERIITDLDEKPPAGREGSLLFWEIYKIVFDKLLYEKQIGFGIFMVIGDE